ncbi:membrane lipoprotein lipid attachment site-containing protein [uncultured Alistipes sp.]|uniref:membrane lipoprotein lipid attachment site-containing protein n=1 Tax=uncultured Alistipes sp. TaxID=538949 RepID=UPI0025F87E9B|nr:membrane lipoprotein lipid attachment site-containing protein [uncultured Alistipes sp.]
MEKIFSIIVLMLILTSCSKDDSNLSKRVDEYLSKTWSGEVNIQKWSWNHNGYNQPCEFSYQNGTVRLESKWYSNIFNVTKKRIYKNPDAVFLNVENKDDNTTGTIYLGFETDSEGIVFVPYFDCAISIGFDELTQQYDDHVDLQGILYNND